MARRRRSMSMLTKMASDYKRKNTNKSISAVYELMWGEKPKRGRPKKRDN